MASMLQYVELIFTVLLSVMTTTKKCIHLNPLLDPPPVPPYQNNPLNEAKLQNDRQNPATYS